MIDEFFLETGAVAARLLGSEATTARWDDPSALEGYTVGGLAGHLARGVLTVDTYLARPAPSPETATTDAAGYFVALVRDHDPVESELHRAVRKRGRRAAADGPAALSAAVTDALQRLRPRLSDVDHDRPVAVRDDLCLPLDQYLRTRLVELVVHLDDLATSVGRPVAAGIPDAAYEVAAEVLVRLAVLREGGPAVVRSLARRERHPGAVRAL